MMATPYDAVLRLRKREVDEAAEAFRFAAEGLETLEGMLSRSQEAYAEESNLPGDDLTLRSDLYLLQMLETMAGLRQDIGHAAAKLEERRAELLQVLAESKALEQLVEAHEEALRLAAERAEQAQNDDRVAFVFRARELERGAAV
jgi:flagellar export protein FliJ